MAACQWNACCCVKAQLSCLTASHSPPVQDSGWVADRQPLEQLRAGAGGAASDEVLLCTADGRLLEGLVTNFFVVTYGMAASDSMGQAAGGEEDGRGSEAAAPSSAGSSGLTSFKPSDVTVWTAGMRDGVVWGTVRARVLQACRTLGYMIREDAPSMHSRQAWREAFITNALRLVQPLRTVSCGKANVWGLPPWEMQLPAAPGPITASLAAALADMLPTCHALDL